MISSGGANLRRFEASNDYKCAKAGYDLLRKRGYSYHFVDYAGDACLKSLIADELQSVTERSIMCVDLWASQSGRRRPEEVARDIATIARVIADLCPDTRVGVLAQGNPLYRDERCVALISTVEDCKVITSPSSAELVLRLLDRVGIPSLPVKNHHKMSVDFLDDHVNVYACLGIHYNLDVTKLIEKLTSAHDVFVVKVGSGESVQRYPGDVVFKNLLHLRAYRESLMDKTVVACSR